MKNQQPFVRNQGHPEKIRTALTLGMSLAAILAFTCPAQGTVIQALGTDVTTGAGWRDPSIAKPAYDPNGDKVYGSDGYYVAGDASGALLSSPPAYITGLSLVSPAIRETGNEWWKYLATINDPTQPFNAPVNITTPADFYVNGGPGNPPRDMFTFTLAQDSAFVLTTIINFSGRPDGAYWSPGIQVSGMRGITSLGSVTESITTDAPGYAFFEIRGLAGDVFTVSPLLSMDGFQVAFMGGLGFEQLAPEPSTVLLLGVGALMVWQRRKRVA